MLRSSRSRFTTGLGRGLQAGVRTYSKSPLSVAFATGDQDETAERYRNQKNPVVPSIANLEVRWLKLDAGKQDDIIAYLEDKMRGSWHELTADEKRAAHYIWYGNWGPRSARPRDMSGIYTGLAGTIALVCVGLAAYKFTTFDAEAEVPGLQYEPIEDQNKETEIKK